MTGVLGGLPTAIRRRLENDGSLDACLEVRNGWSATAVRVHRTDDNPSTGIIWVRVPGERSQTGDPHTNG
jgi:hypothetical protein